MSVTWIETNQAANRKTGNGPRAWFASVGGIDLNVSLRATGTDRSDVQVWNVSGYKRFMDSDCLTISIAAQTTRWGGIVCTPEQARAFAEKEILPRLQAIAPVQAPPIPPKPKPEPKPGTGFKKPDVQAPIPDHRMAAAGEREDDDDMPF